MTLALIFLLIFLKSSESFFFKNNVCTKWHDYNFADSSPNCRYVPDLHLNTHEIVQFYINTTSEQHQATTEDGYILTLFRIPPKKTLKNKGPILFYHGISTDSHTWLYQHENSIAFQFWEQGYDVWLGNMRGNSYSNRHVNLTVDDEEFWEYSFHEVGFYDYKSVIDYINEKTGDKVILVAYSMGGSSALVYASMRPEEAKEKLKIVIGLGPVGYANHLSGPFRYILLSARYFAQIFKRFRVYWYASPDDFYIRVYIFIVDNIPSKIWIPYAISMLWGWNPHNFDVTLPIFFMRLLNSSSIKNYIHFGQLVLGTFQMFDYGRVVNEVVYKQSTPKSYPLDQIRVPLYFTVSKSDIFSTYTDMMAFFKALPKEAMRYGYYNAYHYNHGDYHVGASRKKLFEDILRFLDANIIST